MDLFHHAAGFTALLLTLGASFSAFAQSPEQAPSPSTAPAFEISTQQEPFRRIADEFIAAARSGDTAKAAQMISPAVASRSGREEVERYLTGQVFPFFAQLKELAGSVTVTRTAEVPGFVFYMYMVTSTDDLRPFVIYVIEESGAKVIANVLVDNFVEGRHCARVPDGWRCPDFR
jgi:hypothetical protein